MVTTLINLEIDTRNLRQPLSWHVTEVRTSNLTCNTSCAIHTFTCCTLTYNGFEPEMEHEEIEQLICRATTKVPWGSAKVFFISTGKGS